jgi:hypothetical protein
VILGDILGDILGVIWGVILGGDFGGGGGVGVSYSDDIVFDMFVISILNSNFKYQFKNPFIKKMR